METGQVNERFHAEKEMVMETLFVLPVLPATL